MRRIPGGLALAAVAIVVVLSIAPSAAPVAAGGPDAFVYRRVDGHALRLDAFPVAAQRAPAVVVVHGGGWHRGHSGWYSGVARDLAAGGFAAFSIDYRLSTTAAFPAAVDDVRAAVEWLRAHAGELGIDPSRIALLGGSAGGHLALLAATGPDAVDVAGVVAWSAPTDLAALATSARLRPIVAQLLGCDAAECPGRATAASPVHTVDGEAPPLFLATGSDEFVPATQASALHERATALGVQSELVVVPGPRHATAYRADVWSATTAFLHANLRQ